MQFYDIFFAKNSTLNPYKIAFKAFICYFYDKIKTMQFTSYWRKIKLHFPENKTRWKIYIKYSFPVVISALLFSLNGFVDNFMVTHIPNGVASLSYANSWTAIVGGIVGGIAFVGYTISGQYIGAGKHNRVQHVMRIRFLLSFIFTLFFAIPTLLFPKAFVYAFASKPSLTGLSGQTLINAQNEFQITIDNSAKYLFLIVFSWIILTWTTPLSGLLNETGNGKFGLYSSVFSLAVNIALNIIFMRFLKMGVEGAAYASIVARIVGVFGDTYYVWKKCPKYLINPLTTFKISKKVWKHFLRRSYASVMIFSLTLMIIFRSKFFNVGFPQGRVGETQWAISAGMVLGLTGSIGEIFTTAFFAIGSNVTIFVGQALGKRKFELAKKNANELKGFHTILAIFFSLLLVIIVLILPFMTSIASGIGENLSEIEKIKAQQYYIKEIQLTLLVIAFMNPIWMWFVTSSKLVSSGGKTNLAATMEILSEIIVISWAAIVCLSIVPATGMSLSMAYFIFFLADFIKLIIYESVFLRVDWASHIDDYKSKRLAIKNDRQ